MFVLEINIISPIDYSVVLLNLEIVIIISKIRFAFHKFKVLRSQMSCMQNINCKLEHS